MLVDTGFSQRAEPELRLRDVYAPEIHETGGLQVTEYVNGWLTSVQEGAKRKWPFWISVEMTTTYEPEMRMTFVRYVATVWKFEDQSRGWGFSLNSAVNNFLADHPEWGGGVGS